MVRQNFSWWLVCGLLSGAVPLGAEDGRSRVVTVSAQEPWTDTGVDLERGEALRATAWGSARVVRGSLWERVTSSAAARAVGPQGTYRWPRHDPDGVGKERRAFPLPTMADGPAPAFCLIGKIGPDGEPFYVGAAYEGRAKTRGRLWVGLNDDDFRDNRGRFQVSIQVGATPTPSPPPPPIVEPGRHTGAPIPDARVLLLYVDGLRPDVLRQMAEAGFLPHFKEAFLDRGLEVPHAVTVFPSNTLIANGSLFTGLFSDRTGIKSQNQFERTTLKPRGQLSAWLPDGFIPKPTTRVLNLLDKYAPEHTHAFLLNRRVPTLASRLGKAFRFTALPIAPLNPPPLWFHRAINTMGPFGVSARLPFRLDEVNAAYAVEELLGDPDARVIAVWLPMADKTCHHSRRGQFGAARRDLAFADEYLGWILKRLRELGWERSTYLLLVSDHGHLGGEQGVNRSCNLPRDWAYRRLGCNAKVVGQDWMHPGIEPDRFLFFDNQGAGQAKLFLPYGSYFRGPWRRNRLYELTHYELRPGQPSLNLLEALKDFRPPQWDGRGTPPVDLMLVKLDERRVFVYRDEERQAIIHREADSAGREVYRLEPVRRLAQSPDGELRYEPARPGQDPFGYLQDPASLSLLAGSGWMAAAHSAREWLLATAQARYPDAVVTMAKFFAWDASFNDLSEVRDPDLLVTASEGWSFRSDDGEGTDHGYPLAPSMRMTLLVSGPNVVHGQLAEPHRIVDVLPTILEMIRWPYDPAPLDGRAIHGIYE